MLPYNKNKYDSPSLITAHKHLAYYKGIGRYPTVAAPKLMLLCYQAKFFAKMQQQYRLKQGDGCFDKLFFFEEYPGVAIANFGIGAPIITAKMELLIAWGVKKFISFGTAGAIDPALNVGAIVVCDKAIRDEGTSHHYLPFEPYSYPSSLLKEAVLTSLKEKAIPFSVGTSWTTDSIYRQTEVEVRHLQSEGVLTVEMEAAALFALATCYNVEIASLFTISDTLGHFEWTPHFHHETTGKGWNILLETALAVPLEGI